MLYLIIFSACLALIQGLFVRNKSRNFAYIMEMKNFKTNRYIKYLEENENKKLNFNKAEMEECFKKSARARKLYKFNIIISMFLIFLLSLITTVAVKIDDKVSFISLGIITCIYIFFIYKYQYKFIMLTNNMLD